MDRSLAGSWLAPTETSPSTTRPMVGSGIYGWGQYYQREKKELQAHLDEVLPALCGMGYEFLEGFLDLTGLENNLRFAERCRTNGLKPVCLYTSARLHETSSAGRIVQKLLAAARVCRDAGFTILDVNPEPIGQEKTADELKTQVAALNDLGCGLNDLGMKLGLHNHMPEMANAGRELNFNLHNSNCRLVGLTYDVDWISHGGMLPMDCLKEYSTRIVLWHLRQRRNGIWWEDFDSGDWDYEAIGSFAQEHKICAPLSVELAIEKETKITRTVVENHRRSREYVRRVFGV